MTAVASDRPLRNPSPTTHVDTDRSEVSSICCACDPRGARRRHARAGALRPVRPAQANPRVELGLVYASERARDVRPPRRDPPHAEVRRRLPLRRAASFGRRGRRHLALREELHLLLRRLSRGDGHKRAACQQPAARAGCGARGVRDRAGGQRLPAARETRCAHPSSRRRRERRTPTSTR